MNMNLDENQRKAISAVRGPVCVSAGPGSGKTRVLVERIAHLIENEGVAPRAILAITFTTKAAREMSERVKERLAQKDEELPRIGTFHAFCFEILKEHGRRIGISADFSVAGESEEKFDEKKQGEEKLSFDDLLVRTLELLDTHPDVLGLCQEKFTHIMVDEYQDTSAPQARLLELLAARHGNLCVIGDPNQSIYGFRGAQPQHFYDFPQRYPSAAIISLQKNYRSGRHIVQASDALIGRKYDRGLRSLWVEREEDLPIRITCAASASQEAFHIIKTIQELVGGTEYEYLSPERDDALFHFSDIAVLYRLNAIGHSLEGSFTRASVPHVIVGAVSFFDHPEIREALAILREAEASEKTALSQSIRGTGEKRAASDGGGDRLRELVQIATAHDQLPFQDAREKLLAEAALSRAEDDWQRRQNAVTLMSVHAAKGLEFPVVFVAGAEEGLFPYLKKGEGDERLQEERRLLYVAMTRAKDRLYISHSNERIIFGKKIVTMPSRFLSEIPGEYVEKKTLPRRASRAPVQKKLF